LPLDRHPSATTSRPRSVLLYLAITCLTIGTGLATRRYPAFFPEFIAQYAGDALWAAMVFWILALGWRRAGTIKLALGAMAIAFGVEISQLYHAGWIDAIRHTRTGALALGNGFLWSDLACYAAGAGIAAVLDALIVGRSPVLP
jgi:hypothetical protein